MWTSLKEPVLLPNFDYGGKTNRAQTCIYFFSTENYICLRGMTFYQVMQPIFNSQNIQSIFQIVAKLFSSIQKRSKSLNEGVFLFENLILKNTKLNNILLNKMIKSSFLRIIGWRKKLKKKWIMFQQERSVPCCLNKKETYLKHRGKTGFEYVPSDPFILTIK